MKRLTVGLEIKECENCGLGYLSPRVKFKTAVKLYSNEKTNVPIYSSKTNIKMDKIKYKYGFYAYICTTRNLL